MTLRYASHTGFTFFAVACDKPEATTVRATALQMRRTRRLLRSWSNSPPPCRPPSSSWTRNRRQASALNGLFWNSACCALYYCQLMRHAGVRSTGFPSLPQKAAGRICKAPHQVIKSRVIPLLGAHKQGTSDTLVTSCRWRGRGRGPHRHAAHAVHAGEARAAGAAAGAQARGEGARPRQQRAGQHLGGRVQRRQCFARQPGANAAWRRRLFLQKCRSCSWKTPSGATMHFLICLPAL